LRRLWSIAERPATRAPNLSSVETSSQRRTATRSLRSSSRCEALFQGCNCDSTSTGPGEPGCRPHHREAGATRIARPQPVPSTVGQPFGSAERDKLVTQCKAK
jgi:hypothetical protein